MKKTAILCAASAIGLLTACQTIAMPGPDPTHAFDIEVTLHDPGPAFIDEPPIEQEIAMFSVGEIDVKGLKRFENMLGAVGAEAPKAVNRALNRTGDMARTQVVRTLSRQTGLTQKLVRRTLRVKRASWGDLEYTITSSGGNVPVKYFKKRETADGVRAWLGDARGHEVFAESFFRGGVWPRGRVDIAGMGGHVFVRVGGRTDLEKVLSGVFIPEDMVTGATADAFERVVGQVLPRRLDHEIGRLLGL